MELVSASEPSGMRAEVWEEVPPFSGEEDRRFSSLQPSEFDISPSG